MASRQDRIEEPAGLPEVEPGAANLFVPFVLDRSSLARPRERYPEAGVGPIDLLAKAPTEKLPLGIEHLHLVTGPSFYLFGQIAIPAPGRQGTPGEPGGNPEQPADDRHQRA